MEEGDGKRLTFPQPVRPILSRTTGPVSRMTQPYETLPEDRFWRTAVAERDALEITGLWKPKHAIARRTRIVT
ncbi:hypothetical protein ACS2VC_27280, partial [Bacillus cereus group sp. BC241]